MSANTSAGIRPVQPPLWRAWFAAARPATLPASIVPVVVGTAAAMNGSRVRVAPFFAALVAALLIQIGTNYANDVFDHRKEADTQERLGPQRLIQSGLATADQVFAAACLAFGAAAAIGLYLIALRGWPILVIGVLCILAGIAYTGGPFPLAYHGLGDLFAFVFFGPVAVLGTTYLQLGTVTHAAVIASFAVGLLVTAILIVNNLRDIDTDRAAGKRTLAVRVERAGTRLQYATFILAAFLVPLVLRLTGEVGNWFVLPWLTLPLALHAVRIVSRHEGPTLNRALKRTGQLHLLFGLLLAASFWL